MVYLLIRLKLFIFLFSTHFFVHFIDYSPLSVSVKVLLLCNAAKGLPGCPFGLDVSEKTIYSCKECENCPYRTLCTQSQTGRRIQRATIFTKFRNESLKNITTEKGILLRMNRSIQVEGAFGVLKQDYGFRRFLTRGSENVKIEMLLLCFAFNINKLHKKTIKKEEIHIFLKK